MTNVTLIPLKDVDAFNFHVANTWKDTPETLYASPMRYFVTTPIKFPCIAITVYEAGDEMDCTTVEDFVYPDMFPLT